MHLLWLYPRHWRARYGAEMAVLLEAHRPTVQETVDIARGALDARLHPPTPSLVPPVASIGAGALWTFLALGLVKDPVPADWPGFTADVLPLAFAGACCLLVAVIGLVLRLGDLPARPTAGVAVAIAAVALFVVALYGAANGLGYGAPTGAAMSVAAVAIAGVGLLLLRRPDGVVGTLALVASLALVVPIPAAWIFFGLAWTLIGTAQFQDRARQSGLGVAA